MHRSLIAPNEANCRGKSHTTISIRAACIFPSPLLCNSSAKSYTWLCSGSTAGGGFGSCCAQPQLLCPAQAALCSAAVFKNSSGGNCTEGCTISMGYSTRSGCSHTAAELQIPIYLQISYPAGAICLSVVTHHPASAGGACSASSVLRLLFLTTQGGCLGHEVAQGSNLLDGSLLGKCRDRVEPKNEASMTFRTCPAQGLLNSLKPRSFSERSGPEFVFSSSNGKDHTGTHTSSTRAQRDLAAACINSVSLSAVHSDGT